MKIEKSEVTKIKILDVESLDPISVFMEDFEPGKGKITIECYGKSWSNYWGAMGDSTIAEFFCYANNDYIAGKFDGGLRHNVIDKDLIPAYAKAHIKQLLDNYIIDNDEAKALLSGLSGWSGEDLLQNREILSGIYGDDFWYSLPEKPNHEYEYLCRILDATKEALVEISKDKEG